MPTETRIPLELAEFLESGLAVVVGTRDGDLQPDGAAGWAVEIDEERGRLTVFLHEIAAEALLRNLKSHPEIAVNLDQPTSHRACQVKGVFVASRPARPDERELVERQVEGFRNDLSMIGFPRALTAAWQTWPCVALEMRVTQLFEQTPGPGAGGLLK